MKGNTESYENLFQWTSCLHRGAARRGEVRMIQSAWYWQGFSDNILVLESKFTGPKLFLNFRGRHEPEPSLTFPGIFLPLASLYQWEQPSSVRTHKWRSCFPLASENAATWQDPEVWIMFLWIWGFKSWMTNHCYFSAKWKNALKLGEMSLHANRLQSKSIGSNWQ